MKNFIVLTVLMLLTTFVFGQQPKPTLQEKLQSEVDINTQFQLLLNQSRNQDGTFKIVRRNNLEIIQRNVKDSLSTFRKEIAALTDLTSTSRSTIQALQDTVTSLERALDEEKQKTATIGFLGMDIGKGVYHAIVWSLIAVLTIILLVLLAAYRKAKVDAVEHKATAEEALNDLQVSKKKAMEKEQLLKRQLVDEQLKRNS